MKAETVISIGVAVIGAVLFTTLIHIKDIGEFSYVFLFSLLAFVCLVIPEIKRLLKLDLRKMKIKLEKMTLEKNLIKNLPEDIKLYNASLYAYKCEQNKALKKAIEEDNKSLKESTEKILTQIELQEEIIRELPPLRERFIEVTREIEERKEGIKRFIDNIPSFIISQKMCIEKLSLFAASKASNVEDG